MPDSFQANIHASRQQFKISRANAYRLDAYVIPTTLHELSSGMDTVSPVLIGLITYTPCCPPQVHQVLLC